MSVVVGVDSSTQSCKVLAVDAQSGDVISSGAAAHPALTSVDLRVWTSALREAWHGAGVDRLAGSVAAAGIAAQQHGMVALDSSNSPVHDALLWNDTRSAADAARLRDALGPEAWVDAASRVDQVVLPQDWLNGALGGDFTTDRSDASGTGYFSPVTNSYRADLLERFFGRVPRLPRVVASNEKAGTVQNGWGTSGTVFTSTASAMPDHTGAIAGFADAAGGHLPLLAMLNSARVMAATASMLDVDLAKLDSLALSADSDTGGLTFLPYLGGERSPNLPHASGTLTGLNRSNMTPENLARASVLGVLNSLADAIDVLRQSGGTPDKILLIAEARNRRLCARPQPASSTCPSRFRQAGSTLRSVQPNRLHGQPLEIFRTGSEASKLPMNPKEIGASESANAMPRPARASTACEPIIVQDFTPPCASSRSSR